jgi:hypothetical protein
LENSKNPKWIIRNPKWSVTEKKIYFFSFFPLPFSVRKCIPLKLPLLLLSYILQNSKNPRNIGNILKNGKNRKTLNFPYWGIRGYIGGVLKSKKSSDFGFGFGFLEFRI